MRECISVVNIFEFVSIYQAIVYTYIRRFATVIYNKFYANFNE